MPSSKMSAAYTEPVTIATRHLCSQIINCTDTARLVGVQHQVLHSVVRIRCMSVMNGSIHDHTSRRYVIFPNLSSFSPSASIIICRRWLWHECHSGTASSRLRLHQWIQRATSDWMSRILFRKWNLVIRSPMVYRWSVSIVLCNSILALSNYAYNYFIWTCPSIFGRSSRKKWHINCKSIGNSGTQILQ